MRLPFRSFSPIKQWVLCKRPVRWFRWDDHSLSCARCSKASLTISMRDEEWNGLLT